MGDAGLRAELEDAQAHAKRLAGELSRWPEVSEERARASAEVQALEAGVGEAEARLAAAKARELAALDARDVARQAASRARGRWWMTTLAAPAMVVAFFAAFKAASVSFDYVNWTLWGPRVDWPLLAVAPAVNALRWAWAQLRLRFSSKPSLVRPRSPGSGRGKG